MSSEANTFPGRGAEASAGGDVPVAVASRRVVLAAGIGTVIEFFDFGIYAFLAAILSDNFFSKEDPTAGLLATFAVFGVAFVVRPLGGIWLSHLGDRRGRRYVLALSVTMMAVSTALIGLLPSYGSIGLGAPLLLVILRCIQGVSAGGESGTATTYIAEAAPDALRGRLTAAPESGKVIGTMLASATVAIISMALTREQLYDWGWRLPFLLSLPLGMFALYIRWRIEESQRFVRTRKAGQIENVPFLAALRLHHWALLTAFCMCLLAYSSYYIAFNYLSTYLQKQGIMSVSAATWTTTVTSLLAAISIPFWGALSDRVGRKPVLIGSAVCNILFAYPAFRMMAISPALAVLAQIALGQLSAAYVACVSTASCELFPDNVRLSGFSFGQNLAALCAGGLAPFFATLLIARTGDPTSPAWMLIGTAVISIAALIFIRETAGTRLRAAGKIGELGLSSG
jgi:MHS family proline/betaine transporter-like MFS transporter